MPCCFLLPSFGERLSVSRNLATETYKFDERGKRALSGVRQHFDKAGTFRRLARQLAPGLRLDRDQFNAQGFSPAQRSQEVAAVLEAAVVELYSCVDCTAKVLRAIYERRTKGLEKFSLARSSETSMRSLATSPTLSKRQYVVLHGSRGCCFFGTN